METKTVSFTRFDESSAEDWRLIDELFEPFAAAAPERVLRHFELLKGEPLGYPVDRYEHSLQTATRALRAGADDETVVCALLHDIGDTLAPVNHGAVAAAILAPFVSAENAWLVTHHEVFQGYHYRQFYGRDRNAREKYRGHPAFERTVRFCDEWDQTAFDPAYESLPLEAFTGRVAAVFSRRPWGRPIAEWETPPDAL